MQKQHQKQVKNEPNYIINDAIMGSTVRVVTDITDIGITSGTIMSLSEVKRIAYNNSYDVVLINRNTDPQIVRVCDYSKFLYELKRKQKEADKKQRESNKELKEVRLSANISQGDLDTKTRQVERFLSDGHKVKLTIQFKDRTIKFSERGVLTMLKVAEAVAEVGKADNLPTLTGRNMNMSLSPKK